jgi:hypothetical protein
VHWGPVLILRPSTTVPHASHSARGGTSAPPIGFAGLLNVSQLSVNHTPLFGGDVFGLLAGELGRRIQSRKEMILVRKKSLRIAE